MPAEDVEEAEVEEAEVEEECEESKVEAAAPRSSLSKRPEHVDVALAQTQTQSSKDILWVDNLPNDELGLRSMLAEVRR